MDRETQLMPLSNYPLKVPSKIKIFRSVKTSRYRLSTVDQYSQFRDQFQAPIFTAHFLAFLLVFRQWQQAHLKERYISRHFKLNESPCHRSTVSIGGCKSAKNFIFLPEIRQFFNFPSVVKVLRCAGGLGRFDSK